MDPLVILIIVGALGALALLCVLAGRIVGRYAESKGLHYRTWFWWGVFLPIPAFSLVMLAPSEEQRHRRAAARAVRRDQPRAPRHKRCPDCAETVQYEAKVCKHCGFRFDETAQASTP